MSTVALDDAQRGILSKTGAINAAFDSGYFVLLSVLPEDVAGAAQEHPRVDLVRNASLALRLSKADRVAAEDLATSYYSVRQSMSLHDCVRWAKRVRIAAGLS